MNEANQASLLLTKLENYDFAELNTLFSTYLHPFSLLIPPNPQNPNKKPSRHKQSSNSTSIRSLAKTFLPFISKSLSLIPKRLSETPKHPQTTQFTPQLLQSYKLCLDCLEALSSELSGKPYGVHLQRARFLHCLLRWERYEEGVLEGFRILESLGSVRVESKIGMGKLVPCLVDGNCDAVDADFVHLILDVAVAVAQCVSLSKSKDAGKYTCLLVLLNEIRPWFRYLDAAAGCKLQLKLLTCMRNACMFLVREVKHFEGDLVPAFCAATFEEHTTLFNGRGCQGRMGAEMEEFIKFVSNCTYKCRSACTSVRIAVAAHLLESAGKIIQDLAYFSVIPRLYALGLCLSEFSLQSKGCCSRDSGVSICNASGVFSPEGWDKLQNLSVFLRLGNSYYHPNFEECDKRLSCGGSVGKASAYSESDDKAFKVRTLTNQEDLLSYYLNALKFVCWPLAEYVNAERKRILAIVVECPSANALELIQEAFLQYCILFPQCQQEKDAREEIDTVVLSIFLAAFTLSLKLNINVKQITRLINYLLPDKCVLYLQPQRLKYIIAMLHNIFVEFYRDEQLKEASKAVKLCSRASWSRCLLLCEMLVGKVKGFDGELSETMVADSVNEACKVSSFLVDILHQIESPKLDKDMIYCLEKWCMSRSLFGKLPSPDVLIKRWVKIQCKSFRNSHTSAPILGSYLLDSSFMTTHHIVAETVGIILEQELLAYQELESLHPKFSVRMQLEIIDFLLQKVYDSKKCFQRFDILVKKGMLSRACGNGGLENCINCLSEAIKSIDSHIEGSFGVECKEAAPEACQLAVGYCLHALWTQEANPNSKELFNNIRKAINLFLRIDIPECSSNGQTKMAADYMLLVLYHTADLLSIKGDTALHSDLVNVIIKVIRSTNVSLKRCLSLLWESRRLNHALCVVPVNEAFIAALSEYYGKDAECLDFWISSMKDSQPLSVGLQQNFSYLSSLFPWAFHQHNHSLRTEISVDEVNEVASQLISKVPIRGCTAFVAGCLYYDLSDRLFTSGHIIEALLYAKEAHRLRGKLLQEHFSYSFEQCEEKEDVAGEMKKKLSVVVSTFTVSDKVAIRAWSNSALSKESDGFVLTPWSVLRFYLESTLQVGIIHETLGNGAEAEAQFRLGKNISSLQSLPLLVVTFSSWLGKLYLRKGLFNLGHDEIGTAEQALAAERKAITCSRCLLTLESIINEQLGDLYRKGAYCVPENPYESSLRSLISIEKGNLAVWFEEEKSAYPIHQSEAAGVAESGIVRTDNEYNATCSGVGNASRLERTKIKMEAKKPRKTRKASESLAAVQSCTLEKNFRVTRSWKQSSQNNGTSLVKGVQNAVDSYSTGELHRETTSFSNKVNCQKCFTDELKNFGSFNCFIQMKWEFVRRRQVLRLLIGLGKCKGASTGVQRLRKIYSKSISILLGGNDCNCLRSPFLKLDFMDKEIRGGIWVGECVEVLYALCWFTLKTFSSKDKRSFHCDENFIQMSQVVSFLKLSFVLSREIPLLFQKVARLLAVIHVVSASTANLYSLLNACEILLENYWAAYFHQASVGTHYNVQMLTAMNVKQKPQIGGQLKGSQAVGPRGMITDACHLLRIAPESTEEIEACVAKFFNNLPNTTILCMSVLGNSYVNLLEQLMHHPSGVHGWILLSYLNGDNQPAVVLLPLTSVLQENSVEETSSRCSIFGEADVVKEWHSPWGRGVVVDDVAPLFKLILRGNYVSCSNFPDEDTERNRELWWTWRVSLDECLNKLVRDMEESWFGPWKYMLLGQWSDCEPLSAAVKELLHEIKARCKLDVNESVLKVVMGGIKSANLERERIPWLFLEKGCYIGGVEACNSGRCDSLDEPCSGADNVLSSLFELMVAAVNKLEAEYCTRREPIVLALDSDIQMLPWENMPIMREQEVYRMPSVASIFVSLQRRSVLEEVVRPVARFPLIDPLDAFYLLNPSGDLNRTQAEFEEWFSLQNIQGKAGTVPSTEELTAALETRDLFLYFGHGSGAQYIPPDKIQKLENCAATLLMGCSSGSLNLNGHYAPSGTALSYMLAGSPIVVANLWEVTDLDIDRFAKAVLKSFVDERSMSSTGCVQCRILAEEFKSMSVNEQKGNTKKGRGKKKPVDDTPDNSGGEYCFRHKLRAGYFVSRARKSCKLPYLIGAAPVCYGVPTGIKKKRDI